MKNADMPAMPTPITENCSTAHGTEPTYGLTKREMFAMHAMQGLLAGQPHWDVTAPEIPQLAIQHADALLALLEELSKE